MKQKFLFLIVLSMYGCSEPDQTEKNIPVSDSAITQKVTNDPYLKTPTPTEKQPELKRKDFEEEEKLDSMRLSGVFLKALELANKNKRKTNFTHQFVSFPDDSSYEVKVNLYFGKLFSKNKKHLLIRREMPWGCLLDIMLLENNSFKSVCTRKQEGMTYIDDTLKDVNGDSYKDFLVHWYPSSGCCRRDVYNVYLYHPISGTFTSDYQFINPTFSAREKIIRGVQYGHPGEVGLYKYKWNGLGVDTLEFLYPDTSVRNQFFITQNRKWYRSSTSKKKIVNELPKEYQKIQSIEYFLWY